MMAKRLMVLLFIAFLMRVCARAEDAGTQLPELSFLTGWTAVTEDDGMGVRYDLETEHFSLRRDCDDILILCHWSDYNADQSQQRMYRLSADGRWLAESAINYRYSRYAKDDAGYIEESIASLVDGRLNVTEYITDMDGNLIMECSRYSLPDVLTPDERDLLLENDDSCALTPFGYGIDENGELPMVLMARLFDQLLPDAGVFLGGYWHSYQNLLVCMAEKDGQRTLWCGWYDKAGQWVFQQSTPLPADARFGYENFTDALVIDGVGYGLTRYPDDRIGLYYVIGTDEFNIAPGSVDEPWSWPVTTMHQGRHSWGDITVMDWHSLPRTLDEACTQLSTDGWATPNNPNPADGLNLRSSPDRSAPSLGRFRNGTPVRVLEMGERWCRVEAAQLEGYMMTDYLAFGKDMELVAQGLGCCWANHTLTRVFWRSAGVEELPASRLECLVSVGMADDCWIVWDRYAGRYGLVQRGDADTGLE